MYAHTFERPCTPCMMSPELGPKRASNTHPHSHHGKHTYETRYMRQKLHFDVIQPNKMNKKKDHCEAKRWIVNSELLRGRSKIPLENLLLRCSGPPPPAHLSAIPPHPPPSLHPSLPPVKSEHLLLSSGFVLFEQPCFTLRTQWALQKNKWHEEQMWKNS